MYSFDYDTSIEQWIEAIQEWDEINLTPFAIEPEDIIGLMNLTVAIEYDYAAGVRQAYAVEEKPATPDFLSITRDIASGM